VSGVFAVAGGGHGGAAEQQRSPGEGDPAVGGHRVQLIPVVVSNVFTVSTLRKTRTRAGSGQYLLPIECVEPL
jgi:hypothetical protein